ncbi:VWA-like domain-containing protein [Lacrimispora sp. NSJ-141]|uniref:VWA-like domain-containing protein n=1 Tax=Lientehia hominis TaxID=2897778 RepID=A0AAP2W803_9FIRM|nr:VWA-like domain-containing protein [Lientehia hominis]MCD2492943.1 VWA-like domain-containing protein [Lientehia hominis]
MSKELTEKWDRIGKEILETARNELYLNMRFLDLALCSLSFLLDTEVKRAGTDGCAVHFEPYALAELYQSDRRYLNRLYLHMVFHCLFRHLTRRGKRREDYWNLSCDIAMESIIDGLLKRSVRRAVDPVRKETYEMLEGRLEVFTAEGIYQVLMEQRLTEKQMERLEQAFWVDDHSFWPREESGEPPELKEQLEQKWQDIAERTETRMETIGRDQSEESGNLLDQIRAENRKRCDYRAFLKKFAVLREEMQVDTDSFDYGFYSYGLRLYGNMPLIEPQEFKEVKKIQDFIIAVDTSMSCSGELIKSFLFETYGILSETSSFFKKVNVHIIQCDEAVRSDVEITCGEELADYMENLEIRGGGGTDFRPVFSYVEEQKEKGRFGSLKGLLYFTDGRGIFPKKRPDYDVAFLFMEEDYSDAAVPPWAIKLILEPEDLKPERKRLDKHIRFV